MISRMSKVVAAAALAALLWPTAQANAVCSTGLADSATPACKNAAACQTGIHKAVLKYYSDTQNKLANLPLAASFGGKTVKPVYKCIGGPNNGKPCVHNNGQCKSVKNNKKGCNSYLDCDSADMTSCDKSKQCNPMSANDTNECQIDTSKSAYAKDAVGIRANLVKAVFAACQATGKQVPPSDLGLDQIANCPGVAAAATDPDAYNALVDCITRRAEGDLASGKLVDTALFVYNKVTGTNAIAPQAKPGTVGTTQPRGILQIAGSQSLQVGTQASGSPVSDGGGLTEISGAHCVGGGFRCTKDADCGKNSAGLADTCANNSNTDPNCASGMPCRTLTGPGAVHDASTDGNILTVSAQCSGTISTCLVTLTQDAGNGTPASGHANFAAGEVSTKAPIHTKVYVTDIFTPCASAQPCPFCVAGMSGNTCDSGHTVGGSCSTAANVPTQECLPGAAGPNPPTATIPNPFLLSTEPKSLTANGSNQFCGFCNNDPTQGCAFSYPGGANQECVDKGVGGTCNFGSSGQGFQGDPNVASITADGVRSTYAPISTGIFCTGSADGGGTVDTAAGLPGPVRVTIPYIQAYLFD
ncbi:MAG: hypothetical protein HY270_07425 [Deltaproteobacteria bacterium]|nr:hypothetical protein [Deltaproteobacteria bacterium]